MSKCSNSDIASWYEIKCVLGIGSLHRLDNVNKLFMMHSIFCSPELHKKDYADMFVF
jgi:hypothetical protein